MEPVTVKSKPEDILAAFKMKPPGAHAPYWEQLTPEQQKELEKNPARWLEGHPYLYSAYPTVFKLAEGAAKAAVEEDEMPQKVHRP